jgi:hypothetical protein
VPGDEDVKAILIQNHPGEGQFPDFPKGTAVTLFEECKHYLHWFACEIEGYKTYVPESFVSGGVLTRDYNPTELVQAEGDTVEIIEIVNAWLIAVNDEGTAGWLPAESVTSIVKA